MTDQKYVANVYSDPNENPNVTRVDPKKIPVGLCFSGGGSRALCCAWGQMVGLRNLTNEKKQNCLDDVQYISSVSGGTWASVLYTYLPDSIPEHEFFGDLVEPEALTFEFADEMSVDRLGHVPLNFSNLTTVNPTENIFSRFISIVLTKGYSLVPSLKWLWMYIVGIDVMQHFQLYEYEYSFWGNDVPWKYEAAKSFSWTEEYAKSHVLPNAPEMGDRLHYCHAERPLLIMNTNIVGVQPDSPTDDPIQIPIQVSPIAGGAYGRNPIYPNEIATGGSVESFAFTSDLVEGNSTEAKCSQDRMYELTDIAACSSAFFAAYLAQKVYDQVQLMAEMDDEDLERVLQFTGSHARACELAPILRTRLEKAQADLEISFPSLVPQYNFWPVGDVSQGPQANAADTQFTDGGDLENTGVFGLVSQTAIERIVAFVNTSEKLRCEDDVIIAAAQVSPLFGVAFRDEPGNYEFALYESDGRNPFTKKIDPKGFLQIFDNGQDQFGKLRKELFKVNRNEASASFYKQELSVIPNVLGGIAKPRSVTVLWVQNSVVHDWQDRIGDHTLRAAIERGQQDGTGLFANFPYYDTFTKAELTAAEANSLAQMWAWCVSSHESSLRRELESFLND